ncbi:MAG: hypothetical protein WC865_16745 [Bacteroidales bacterium]
MEAINIEIINPKAKRILKSLKELNLIRISKLVQREVAPPSPFVQRHGVPAFAGMTRLRLAHQHISTSAHQHISTSAHQHISTSAHQHIK